MHFIKRLYKDCRPGSEAATLLYLNVNLRKTLLWSDPVALTKDMSGIFNVQYSQSAQDLERKGKEANYFQMGLHNLKNATPSARQQLRDFPESVVDNVRIFPARLPKGANDYQTILLAPGTEAHRRYIRWCQGVLFAVPPAGTYLLGRPFLEGGTVKYHYVLPSRHNPEWLKEDVDSGLESAMQTSSMSKSLALYLHPEVLGLGVSKTIDAWHDMCFDRVIQKAPSESDEKKMRSSPVAEPSSIPHSYLEHRWQPVGTKHDKIWVLQAVPFESMSAASSVRGGYAADFPDYLEKLKIRKEFLRPHHNRNLMSDFAHYYQQ